jgi:hypothetical protein
VVSYQTLRDYSYNSQVQFYWNYRQQKLLIASRFDLLLTEIKSRPEYNDQIFYSDTGNCLKTIQAFYFVSELPHYISRYYTVQLINI